MSSTFSRELLAPHGITKHRQERPEPIFRGLSSVTAHPSIPKAQQVPRDGGSEHSDALGLTPAPLLVCLGCPSPVTAGAARGGSKGC